MSKSSDEVTQTSAPWPAQAPYLAGGGGKPGLFPLAAQWLRAGGPNYFPNSTVAPFAPEQEAAMSGITNRALSGSPVEGAAQNYLTGLLSNPASGANPALDSVFADIQNRVGGAVGSTFEGAGRTGSPLHAINLGDTITRAYAPFAFDAYNQNANRQMQGLSMAPEISGLDYRNLSQLMGVGGMRQQMGQAQIGDAQARWDFEQNKVRDMINQYQAWVTGNYGGTITQPSYSNPAAGALGGAATGAGAGMAFGPWGAAIGAIGGGLLGGLGS